MEIFGGICPIGHGRILLTDGNLSFDMFHLPRKMDPESFYSGLDKSKCRINISNIEREPSIGKALQFFKYFNIASKFGKPITFFMATNEYLQIMRDNAKRVGVSSNLLEGAVSICEERFRKTIEGIRDNYYPNVNVTILASTDPIIESYIDRLSSSKKLIYIMERLGEEELSCAREHHGETEVVLENERRYAVEWLLKGGNLLTKKQSPSRIILALTGDIFTYLSQSLWVYNQLVPESAKYRVKDRIAFIGVSTAPQIRRSSQGFQTDDYLRVPEDVMFLGDEEAVIMSGINSALTSYKGKKPRSAECVVYNLLREVDFYTRKKDPAVAEILSNCRSPTPRYKHDVCKAMLTSQVLELKAQLCI